MYLKNIVFKYLKDKYYAMIVYKLYYENLLDIIPRIFDIYQVLATRKEDKYFVLYLKVSNNPSKFTLLKRLDDSNIPNPLYIYIIDTKNRKKYNIYTLNKRNVNRIKNVLNK